MFSKVKWYLWQLFPMTYRSHYTDVGTGRKMFCVWKMWLGRSYAIERSFL